MSEGPQVQQPAQPATCEGKNGSRKKLFIILCAGVSAPLAGGVLGYFHLLVGKGKSAGPGHAEAKMNTKVALVALDPFVLNLAEQGKFLKMSVQLEMNDGSYQQTVNVRIPLLRDATRTRVSSKSADSVSSPEGKFQLKDELLLRENQVMGRDVFKNLYFTEFIMQ
ncbi:MAG: flagellar basal body-associated protein FliL [Chloroflexota bacterium]